MTEEAIATANALLRDKGYAERDLAVHPGLRGRALLKGNKILSPFSDDAELGHKLIRPADLRAKL